MSLTAVILILISAVSHAGWNILGKRENPAVSFFLVTNIFGTLLFSPIIVYHFSQVLILPPILWVYLAASGFCLAVYFSGLAGAYRAGDMSIAYPLARSSPVLVVTFVALVLGRGNQITLQSICGILLVVSGCFLVPLRRFGDFRPRNYLNATCLLALLAALGTAGYSIIDDEALRTLRTAEGLTIDTITRTLVYGCLQGGFTVFWLGLSALLIPSERVRLRRVIAVNKTAAVLTGGLMFMTYALVLVSLGHVRNVSYVVAFRQVSILVGTLFSVIFLKERLYRPRLIGVIVIFIGLVLVGTG
ncbi:EamA family transporter [bacterium]|nr:EamA family transporter [bacterium]